MVLNMKKAPVLLIALLSLGSASLTASAQTSLVNLGSTNFIVDSDATTIAYSQSSTNLTLNSPITLGDTLGGVFSTAANWSAYTNTNTYTFGLFMSAPGASPGIRFTVEFYNGAIDGIVNSYEGVASGLGTNPTFIALDLSLPGTGDLSSIGGLQFTWDGAGTGTVVVDSVGVVPEPSTYALLLLGGASLWALKRRKS
jgi:hypothetical protein